MASKLRSAMSLGGGEKTSVIASFRQLFQQTSLDQGLELLSEDERDQILASKWGTVRSLINAIISAGVLGLAFRMKISGSITVMVLMALSAFMVVYTMNFLYKASLDFDATGYVQTVEKAWSERMGRVVLFTLSFGQMGTIIAYFNVLRDSIPWVIQFAAYGCVEAEEECEVDWYASSYFIIGFVTVLFILPISCLSDPDVFAKISFTTFVHFFLFACLVFYGIAEYGPNSDDPVTVVADDNKTEEYVWPEESNELFRLDLDAAVTMAVLAFSLSAHTTCMTLFHGVRFKEDEKSPEIREGIISKIVYGSTFSVYLYYGLIALGCFAIFGQDVEQNSLNSFPADDGFASVIRCTYFFEIGTSIPIFVYALRRNLMIPFMVDDSETAIDAFDERFKLVKWVVTAVMLGICFIIGFLGELDVILSVTGSIFSTINVYIVPSLLMMSTSRESIEKKYFAPVILVLGFFCGVVGLIREMQKFGWVDVF